MILGLCDPFVRMGQIGMVIRGHVDAPREVPQHSARPSMGTPHLRRATDADAAAVARLVPGLVPSASDERRATFVIDGPGGAVAAVLRLVQAGAHMLAEHFKAPEG